jgi:hypothetical protein
LDLRPTGPRFEIPTFWGSFSTSFFEERVDVKPRRCLIQIAFEVDGESRKYPREVDSRTLENASIQAIENPVYVFSVL